MPEILLQHSLSVFITFFLLLSAVFALSCSICHFLMPPPLLTTPSFLLSSALALLSPLPGLVLPSFPDFLLLCHLSCLPSHTSAYTLLSCFSPHRCVKLSSRRRLAGLLWHPWWRKPRWQYRLGGGERDGEAGVWRRRLRTSQNHGKRSVL